MCYHKNMLILEKIQSEPFSDSQQSVINFILEDPPRIENMTIREIARASYTSNATLIRIAHRLGFEGWEDFKTAFLEEHAYTQTHFTDVDPNIPFVKGESITRIAHKIADLKKEALDDTLQLLDDRDLQKAVDILVNAKQIQVIGMMNNKLQADSFALKCSRIRKPTRSRNPQGEIRYDYSLEEPGTAVILISYTGETTSLVWAAEDAVRAGNPVIAITSIGDNTLTSLATVSLRTCTREKLYSKISWYTSEASINLILDILYSGIFEAGYDKNMEAKFSKAEQIERGRIAPSGIISEKETH